MIVLDPTLLETQLSKTSLIVVVNKHGDVCCCTKMGGIALPPKQMQKCVEIARTRVESIIDAIQAAVDADLILRQVEQKGLAPKTHQKDYQMESLGP